MIPCTDQALEQRVISLMLHEPKCLDGAFVTPGELTDRRAVAALRAGLALHARGEAVDTVTVRSEMLRLCGSVDDDYLLSALNVDAMDFPGGSIAQRLRELAVARTLREQLLNTIEAVERGDLPKALARIASMAETRDPGKTDPRQYATLTSLLSDGLREMYANLEKRGETPILVETGIAAVDEAITGFERGDLAVIGGDTSVGKSSTVLLMAIEMAKRGHRPGIISLEDPRQRWNRRVIAAVCGIPVTLQKRCDLSQTQWTQLGSGIDRVKAMGIEVHFAFREGGSLRDVIEAQRALLRDQGCDVIIGDYLQAVEDCGGHSRRDDMRLILSRSRAESSRAAIPAVTIWLSQMRKRENEHEKPERVHLYEANDIAQKADHILLLWKDRGGVLNGVVDKTKDEATGLEFVIERDRNTGMLVSHLDGSRS